MTATVAGASFTFSDLYQALLPSSSSTSTLTSYPSFVGEIKPPPRPVIVYEALSVSVAFKSADINWGTRSFLFLQYTLYIRFFCGVSTSVAFSQLTVKPLLVTSVTVSFPPLPGAGGLLILKLFQTGAA